LIIHVENLNVALLHFLAALLLLLRSNAPRVKIAAVELLIARACEDPSLTALSCAEIQQRPGEKTERKKAVERESEREKLLIARACESSSLLALSCAETQQRPVHKKKGRGLLRQTALFSLSFLEREEKAIRFFLSLLGEREKAVFLCQPLCDTLISLVIPHLCLTSDEFCCGAVRGKLFISSKILYLERERGTEKRRDVGLTCDEFCSGAVRGEKFIPTRNSASWRSFSKVLSSVPKSTLKKPLFASQKYSLRFKFIPSRYSASWRSLFKSTLFSAFTSYMSQAIDF
jgi:hypothetical protein